MKKRFIPSFISILMLFTGILTACTNEGGEGFETSVTSDQSLDDKSENESKTTEESNDESEPEDEVSGDINEPTARPTDYPTLSGGFMQPGAFKNYSVSRMKEHLQYMQEVGIDTLILQWSFETAGDKVTTVYFDSSFGSGDKAATFDESGRVFLDTLLKAAEESGTKVFIGLNDNAEWWEKGVSDKAWLKTQAELGVKGAQQIYSQYKEKYPNAVYGWYFVFEFYNMEANSVIVDNAAYLLNEFRNGLYDIAPEMPMMLSPFISSAGVSAEETGRLWKNVFDKTDFRKGDIFCCQDSVGAGHISIDKLDAYFKAIKSAVDSKEGLRFWANNEDFDQTNWSTAPLDRFIEQLNISSKYVEAHITFAYSHYQNPDVGKIGYHNAYKTYYETGKIPETTLSKPKTEYKTEDGGTVVKISATIDNPDKTFMGFNVYKDGKLLKYIDFSNDYGNDKYNFDYTDNNINGNGTVKYEICGVDYYNNEGPKSEFTVGFEGKDGENAALGKSYVSLLAAETNYPDDEGKSLTDGKFGNATYSDSAWSGYLGKPEFVFDLGTKRDIYAVDVSTLGGGSAAVFAPNCVTVWVSDNGKDFKQAIIQTFDPDNGVDSQMTVLRTVVLNETVSARYVKITVTTNQSWIFIDEISIYAE